jgi:diacylglycerol kinase family enzyme
MQDDHLQAHGEAAHGSAGAAALKGRLVAILNTASGSVTAGAPDEVRRIFDAAGLAHGEVVCAAPEALESALDDAVSRADVLVVLGGDGTIRTAAEKSGRNHNILVPLPGGTMNMLPKALYGPRDWRRALADTLADPEIHCVSGGRAGAHAFFVAALIGAPTLWADARESLRAGRLIEACRRSVTAIRRGMSEPLDYAFDSTLTGSAEAVAVMCPLVSKVMREDEPQLEAAAIDTRSAAELLRLGVNTLFNDWRADPSVIRSKVSRVTITGHGRVPVIVDGERVRLGRRVEIEFTPLAFRALVPAHSDQPASV